MRLACGQRVQNVFVGMDTLELDIAPVVGEPLQSAFSDLASVS